MAGLREVLVEAKSPSRLAELVGAERIEQFEQLARAASERLSGRRVVNVNSTASGGGVAEMLQTLLAYTRRRGDRHPLVGHRGQPCLLRGDEAHPQQPVRGIGRRWASSMAPRVRSTRRRSASRPRVCRSSVRPGDVALLHDPQPAGLTDAIRAAGARRRVALPRRHRRAERALGARRGTSCTPTSPERMRSCSPARTSPPGGHAIDCTSSRRRSTPSRRRTSRCPRQSCGRCCAGPGCWPAPPMAVSASSGATGRPARSSGPWTSCATAARRPSGRRWWSRCPAGTT